MRKPGPNISQIPVLDGVRGIAALMVMIFHGWLGGAFNGLGAWSRLAKVCVFGQTGVDLFFVLSGFLITRILIATKESPHYFVDFYARRALRIFPLYYFFLLLYYFVFPLIDKSPLSPLSQSWWYWAYLQNVPDTFRQLAAEGPGHFWSLAVEEHFYLLWPLLVLLTPVRKLFIVSLIVIIAAILTRAVFLYGYGLNVFTFTFCRMDALAMGALLACLEGTGQLTRFKWVFVVILATVLPLLSSTWVFLTGEGSNWMQLSKFTIIALFYGSLTGALISFQHSPWLRTTLAGKPLRLCGKISYGLYVYHPSCFGLVFYATSGRVPKVAALGLGIATTFLVSWLSYHFFESYFLRLKKFFLYADASAAPKTVGSPVLVQN